MTMKINVAAVAIMVMMVGCAKKENVVAQVNSVTIKYTESTADFPNPERGFYRFSSTKAGNFAALTASQLNAWKKESVAEGGDYKVNSTLIFRYYEMDIFKNQELSSSFINAVNNDF